MDVAGVIARIRPWLSAPSQHSDEILEQLSRHRSLADFEVVRFLVARHTEGFVQGLLVDPDPLVRRTAVRWVELTFARSPAARILRDATKDRSKLVRRAAQRATHNLRLDDVALPLSGIVHAKVPDRVGTNPFTKQSIVIAGRPAVAARRAYDVTGWRFGLHPSPSARSSPTPAFSALQDRADVEQLLGVSSDELSVLLRPGAGPGAAYVAFEIPKARGGTRQLLAPRAPLKRLQRTVLKALLEPLEVHAAAHGFVPGRSTVSNAQPHVGARVVVKLDLVDFFPTIHFGRVVGLLRYYGMGAEAARTVAAVVTFRPKLPDGRVAWPSTLPQGAPTSPALSNLVCRRLDARLAAFATTVGAAYTRYADDLTFSFREEPERLGHVIWWINQIIGQEGFLENLPKRRILRRAGRISVTGLVTNTGLSVPREARRRFRALLHNYEQLGPEALKSPELEAQLLGFTSYVAMVQPELGARLRADVKRVLAQRT